MILKMETTGYSVLHEDNRSKKNVITTDEHL